MDLNNKIEEIRQKPEHIRLRYVWGGVAISMFFIVIIWVFSLNESMNKVKPTENSSLPDIKQSLEEIQSTKDSIPSISDMTKDSSASELQNSVNEENLKNEGIQPTQNTIPENMQIPNPPSEKLNKSLPPKQ